MELGLEDRVVIVTGASRGIGRAVAEQFVREGAHVLVCARGRAELETAAAQLRDLAAQAAHVGDRVLAVFADVTVQEDVDRVVEAAREKFETVHVLVNNVGGTNSMARFQELSDNDWRAVFESNLLSAVRMTRAVLPLMRKQRWGRIINIVSESGVQPDPGMPHYNAAKAALINLTKSLSKDVAADGVLVNAVSPAFVRTPLVDRLLEGEAKRRGISSEAALDRFLAENRPHIELNRPGRPEEVAAVTVFLASERASFVNGATWRVDGGSVATMAL